MVLVLIFQTLLKEEEEKKINKSNKDQLSSTHILIDFIEPNSFFFLMYSLHN